MKGSTTQVSTRCSLRFRWRSRAGSCSTSDGSRANDIKVDVEVHDYLDPGPVFRKMHTKRLATYSTLGFDVPSRR